MSIATIRKPTKYLQLYFWKPLKVVDIGMTRVRYMEAATDYGWMEDYANEGVPAFLYLDRAR